MFRKFFCFARRSEAGTGGNAGRDSKIRKRIFLEKSSNFVQQPEPDWIKLHVIVY